MRLFKTREESLEQLIAVLPVRGLQEEEWTVLCLSGGAELFAEGIARAIKGSVDYLFSETITAPLNKECPVAVVSETEEIVLNKELIDAFEVGLDYIYGEAKRKHDEQIIKNIYKYRKGEILKNLKNQNVMLVDEGADTGLTLMVALKTVLAMEAKKISVAIPVIPKSVVTELSKIVDDVYFVHQLENYVSSGHYYEEYDRKL
ncbi:MAG: phosphoribosyltransferase [Helicobacteraceae bacterium]